MSEFLVSRHSAGVRIDITDPRGPQFGQTWILGHAQGRALRDSLTITLYEGPEPELRLPCRITSGRKACRGCGATIGQAHAETCPHTLKPPTPGQNDETTDFERRIGPPERREPTREFSGADLARDPPTPEEKAAGERHYVIRQTDIDAPLNLGERTPPTPEQVEAIREAGAALGHQAAAAAECVAAFAPAGSPLSNADKTRLTLPAMRADPMAHAFDLCRETLVREP